MKPNKVFLVNSGCGLADREETAESERDLYAAGYVKVEFLRYEWRRWAWPGSYPIFYICADGGVLCSKCANKEIELTGDPDADNQWRIVDADINYEDECYCDHCADQIEAAYL